MYASWDPALRYYAVLSASSGHAENVCPNDAYCETCGGEHSSKAYSHNSSRIKYRSTQ